ncbi:MAG: hypothetical protein FWC08_07535, partial [Defluviitaleaceae bacterium]|nr:hypothetical protein [Defluviitaleaceae bacterium]
ATTTSTAPTAAATTSTTSTAAPVLRFLHDVQKKKTITILRFLPVHEIKIGLLKTLKPWGNEVSGLPRTAPPPNPTNFLKKV